MYHEPNNSLSVFFTCDSLFLGCTTGARGVDRILAQHMVDTAQMCRHILGESYILAKSRPGSKSRLGYCIMDAQHGSAQHVMAVPLSTNA